MKPLIKEIDYYLDENGFVVFTEKYLLERGHCCGNGCRHCPFESKNISVLVTESSAKHDNEL
jgi:hypothetical protein